MKDLIRRTAAGGGGGTNQLLVAIGVPFRPTEEITKRDEAVLSGKDLRALPNSVGIGEEDLDGPNASYLPVRDGENRLPSALEVLEDCDKSLAVGGSHTASFLQNDFEFGLGNIIHMQFHKSIAKRA